jgi:transposase InsO family protein
LEYYSSTKLNAPDFEAARLAMFEYIEFWYNKKRIHSSIGYISPQKCEDLARKIV